MRINLPFWLQVVLAIVILAAIIYLTKSFDWVFETYEHDYYPG